MTFDYYFYYAGHLLDPSIDLSTDLETFLNIFVPLMSSKAQVKRFVFAGLQDDSFAKGKLNQECVNIERENKWGERIKDFDISWDGGELQGEYGCIYDEDIEGGNFGRVSQVEELL